MSNPIQTEESTELNPEAEAALEKEAIAVLEEHAEGLSKLPNWTPELQEKVNLVSEGFLKGELFFKDILKLSGKHLNIIYLEAYNQYHAGKYKKAEEAFRILCFLHPSPGKYWLGLGASLQMQKRFVEALEAYAFGMLQDPIMPKLYVHSADCLLAINKKDDAQNMLKAAIQAAKCDPQYSQIQSQCEKLLSLVKQIPSNSSKTEDKE